MDILKITPRGYCHGVVDAIRIAKHVGEETKGPVHMLGLLVHNTHVTDEMQEHGVKLVDAEDRRSAVRDAPQRNRDEDPERVGDDDVAPPGQKERAELGQLFVKLVTAPAAWVRARRRWRRTPGHGDRPDA